MIKNIFTSTSYLKTLRNISQTSTGVLKTKLKVVNVNVELHACVSMLWDTACTQSKCKGLLLPSAKAPRRPLIRVYDHRGLRLLPDCHSAAN